MSGVKRVTLTTYEHNRLRSQAAKAESLSVTNAALTRLNASLEASVRDANARISSMNGKLDSVNRALASQKRDADAQAENLRQQLAAAVANSNAQLAAQASKHEQQLQTMQQGFQTALDQTREEVASSIAANNRRIEQVIAANNQALREEIQDVRTSVIQVTQVVEVRTSSDESLLAMARQYQRAAEELNADSQTYRCELLLPGQLQPVLDAQGKGDADIALCATAPTNASVARDNAREAYEAALAFHERIVQAEQAWNLANQAAAQAVASVRSAIEAGRVVQTREGNATAQTDVEHWSNGGITALTQRADGLESSLGNSGNTLADLQRIQAAAQQLEEDVCDTVTFAMGAFISSQKRPDCSATLGRSIKECTGLTLVSHGYDGGDQRAAHRMVLRNPHTGLEVIVIQIPEVQPDGTVVNRLEQHIVNYGGNNVAATEQDLAAALSVLGGIIQTVPGYNGRASDLVTVAQTQQQLTETATTVATCPAAAKAPASTTQNQ